MSRVLRQPEHQTATLQLDTHPVSLTLAVTLTPSGLRAIGRLVSSILLSAAVIVAVAKMGVGGRGKPPRPPKRRL